MFKRPNHADYRRLSTYPHLLWILYRFNIICVFAAAGIAFGATSNINPPFDLEPNTSLAYPSGSQSGTLSEPAGFEFWQDLGFRTAPVKPSALIRGLAVSCQLAQTPYCQRMREADTALFYRKHQLFKAAGLAGNSYRQFQASDTSGSLA